MKLAHPLIALALLGLGATAHAQQWSPQKNVEIIVGSAPGGSNDKTARTVERILTQNKIVTVPITVVNRPGGGSTIAFNHVFQREGDPHTLLIATTALLTNHIVGSSKLSYRDFTPVASLFNDYVVFVVNPDSPIKTGKDLAERLRKDPQSISIGFATTLGSHNHIAAGLLMKSLGANPRDLKAVPFKGSSLAITALLGGHIDLVTTAGGNVSIHVASGKLRVVAASANQRFPGVLAGIPTWKEQGVDLVYGGFRGLVAPKGVSPAQVAYWENVLHRATQVPEWKEDLEKNFWTDVFLPGAEFRKDLDKTYADMRSVLIDLGLAK
jgi:putative tricarboxylic transport membrane protein